MGITSPFGKGYDECSFMDIRGQIISNLANAFVDPCLKNGITTIIFAFAQFNEVDQLIDALNNPNVSGGTVSANSTFTQAITNVGFGPFFKQIVEVAKAHGIESVLSFGGATASEAMYSFPTDPSPLADLVKALTDFGFSGIDLDIEGGQGSMVLDQNISDLMTFGKYIISNGLTFTCTSDIPNNFVSTFKSNTFTDAFTDLRVMAYSGGRVATANYFESTMNKIINNNIDIANHLISPGFQDGATYGGDDPGTDAANLLCSMNKTLSEKLAQPFFMLDTASLDRFLPTITQSPNPGSITGTYDNLINTFDQDFMKQYNKVGKSNIKRKAVITIVAITIGLVVAGILAYKFLR
jgi:hypothetical protein